MAADKARLGKAAKANAQNTSAAVLESLKLGL